MGKLYFLRPRYFYFFRPTLARHVHLYHSWVMAARSHDLNMTLMTHLKPEVFSAQRNLVNYWRCQPATQVGIARKPVYEDEIIAFFKWQCLVHRRIVVHLRKQPSDPFIKLRLKTRGRLRFIVEIEGDLKSESDFLKEHPYKPGFYNDIIANIERNCDKQENILQEADHILVVSDYLRNILCERFPHLNLGVKVSVVPTGGTLLGNELNKAARERIRSKNGWAENFLITYIGNVFYSWQSLSSCLNAFKLIRKHLRQKAKLLLFIRKQDWSIAKDFVGRAQLSTNDYFLSSVHPHELGAYMSACDLGLLLRPKHPATLAGSPGKFGDYVLNGLPVLMSEGVGDYAQMVKQDKVFPIIDNIDSEDEIINCAQELIKIPWEGRKRIARWGRRKISSIGNNKKYVDILKKVLHMTYSAK